MNNEQTKQIESKIADAMSRAYGVPRQILFPGEVRDEAKETPRLVLEVELTREGCEWAGVAKLRGTFDEDDLDALAAVAEGRGEDVGSLVDVAERKGLDTIGEIARRLGADPGDPPPAQWVAHQVEGLLGSSKRGQQYREKFEEAFRQVARRHGETPPVPGQPQALLDGVLYWASQEVDETLAKLQGEIEEITGEVLEGEAIVAHALGAISDAHTLTVNVQELERTRGILARIRECIREITGESLDNDPLVARIRFSIDQMALVEVMWGKWIEALGLRIEGPAAEMWHRAVEQTQHAVDRSTMYSRLRGAMCETLGISPDISDEEIIRAMRFACEGSERSISDNDLRSIVVEALCLRDNVSRKDLVAAIRGMASPGIARAYRQLRDIVGGEECDSFDEVIAKAQNMRSSRVPRAPKFDRIGIELPNPLARENVELRKQLDEGLREMGRHRDESQKQYTSLRMALDEIFGTDGWSDAAALNMIRKRGEEVSGEVAQLRYLLEGMRRSATLSSDEAKQLAELGRSVKDRGVVTLGNLTTSAWPFEPVLDWAERINASVRLVDEVMGLDSLVPEGLDAPSGKVAEALGDMRKALESGDPLGALRRLATKARETMPIENDTRADVEAETAIAIDKALREMCERIGYEVDEDHSAEEICRGVATSILQLDQLACVAVDERTDAPLEGDSAVARLAELLGRLRSPWTHAQSYRDLLSILRERVGKFEAESVVQDMPPRTLVDALAARQQAAEAALEGAVEGAHRVRSCLVEFGVAELGHSDGSKSPSRQNALARLVERMATECEKYARRRYRLARNVPGTGEVDDRTDQEKREDTRLVAASIEAHCVCGAIVTIPLPKPGQQGSSIECPREDCDVTHYAHADGRIGSSRPPRKVIVAEVD